MIDPEKLDRELALMVAGLADSLEGAEPQHVLARMQTQVVPAFQRWKAGEVNRKTDDNSILNALVCFVASQMVGAICEIMNDADPGKAHFQLANSVLQGIGEEVGAIMSGERQMDSFVVPAESSH